MLEFVFYLASFLGTAAGLVLFIRFSGRLGSLDIPNERSSHQRPTVRGGGVVIVAVALLLYLLGSYVIIYPLNWGFILSALIIALVSWADDHFDLHAAIRLAAHAASAIIIIVSSGPLTGIDATGTGTFVSFSWLAPIVTFVWIVWMTNAFNFMDGIDGIAGSQGVVSAIGWMSLGILIGSQPVQLFAGVLLFSCLGFLLFNWSPARIFMGDVGSAFLGFTFSAMPLIVRDAKAVSDPLLFLAGVVFLWLFVFDTVFTFIRRLINREKVWKAHRSHLYQNLTSRWGSHAWVSLLFAGLGFLVAAILLVTVSSANAGNWWVIAALFASAMTVTILGYRKSN